MPSFAMTCDRGACAPSTATGAGIFATYSERKTTINDLAGTASIFIANSRRNLQTFPLGAKLEAGQIRQFYRGFPARHDGSRSFIVAIIRDGMRHTWGVSDKHCVYAHHFERR